MQEVSQELNKMIADSLHIGDARPVSRVEVDRMTFIPGDVTELTMPLSYFVDMENGTEDIPTTTSGVSDLVYPVMGRTYSKSQVNSPYGMRMHPIEKRMKMHYGIDLAVTANGPAPIVAVAPGVIEAVTGKHSDNTGFGLCVRIKHDTMGCITLYAHLDSIHVTRGQKVNAGDVIGLAGNTGGSSGKHLHFEVRLNGTTRVDPAPYLSGTKSLSVSNFSALPEGTTTLTGYSGVPGAVLLKEDFTSASWNTNKKYTLSPGFLNIAKRTTITDSLGTYNCLNLPFVKGKTASQDVTWTIKLTSKDKAFLRMQFASDFDKAAGDSLKITVNGKERAIDKFNGLANDQATPDIFVDAGTSTIIIKAHWAKTASRTLRILSLTIQEAKQVFDMGTVTDDSINVFLFGAEGEKVTVPTGRFVYYDTLTVDAVQNFDMSFQYDSECAEATIVLANKDGYLSPDYNPIAFGDVPDTTPWSYYVEGFRYGVFSENTPIRIYVGFGDQLVRKFTGLIDKVDISGDGETITITARDMYKRVQGKVLTEDKQYSPTLAQYIVSNDATQSAAIEEISLKAIVAAAKSAAGEYGIDPRFLLAICKQETVFGTAGAGRPENGTYILGYGRKKPQYSGISAQMRAGADRYYKSLASRKWLITSVDTVRYFQHGGDLGTKLTWCPETEWAPNVWRYYQEICADPKYDTMAPPTAAQTDMVMNGTAWVKSSAVHDLAAHAGMIGWRMNEIDQLYPDIVLEETYLMEADERTGMVIKAVTGEEGKFTLEEANSTPTPFGWMNPFCEMNATYKAYETTVGEAISDLLKDTNMRAYCDRFGTFRLEEIRYKKPIVATYEEGRNLMGIQKTIDTSKTRSHLIITNAGDSKDSSSSGVSAMAPVAYATFVDKELYLDLKGEIRSAVVSVPWAASYAAKREVASKLFFDMKRLSRTLQVTIPGNPALEVLDRIRIVSKKTATSGVYIIKGIRDSFYADGSYVQVLDLMWSAESQI